jgi:Outer membrane receptor proteins, mostly Fe transport
MRLCKRWLCLAIIAVLCHAFCLAGPALAQEEGMGGVSLDVLEISAPKDTTQRITQDEIQRIGATNLWETMSLAPGVTLDNIGARNDSRLTIRGFTSNQIAVMLDGIPVQIPYDRNEDFSRYLVDDLESIEVSKGYSSVLTGANAMGGVINLVSARPKKKLEAKLRYVNAFDSRGKDMSRHVQASMGTKQDLFFLKASGSFIEQDFFRISDDFKGSPHHTFYTSAYQNQPGGKRKYSGYRDMKLNVQAGITPTETSEIVFAYIAQRGDKEQPPYDGKLRVTDRNPTTRNWNWPQWDKDSYSLNIKFMPVDNLTIKANAYYDTYVNVLEDYGTDWSQSAVDNKSKYDDYAYGGRFEANYKFNDMHNLAASLSYRRDAHRRKDTQIIGSTRYPAAPWHKTADVQEDLWIGALEYTITPIENVSFVFGTSYTSLKPHSVWDDADANSVALTKGDGEHSWDGQGGVFWDVNPNHQVYATVAKKSRMPSMRDRYRVTIGNNSGVTRMPNPDLKPERAMHYEMGWRGTIHNKIKVGWAVFYSEVKDLIAEGTIPDTANPGSTIPQNQNIEKTTFTGSEVSIDFAANEWLTFGGNLSYVEWDIRKSASNNAIQKITSLPNVKANAYMIITPLEGLTLIPRVEYRTDSYFSGSRKEKTDEFALAHFKAVYEFLDYFSVEAGVNNIFDTHYAYEEGFSMPGRTFFVGMTFTF